MASAPGSASKAPVIEVVDDSDDDGGDDEDSVDEEQLDEYREMVENLGNFPDKVQINSLTMVAEDYSETRKGAKAIYNIIRERLLSATVAREKLLPLVYLVDSIIKNAKGHFVKVIQADAIHWMPTVYKRLDSAQNVKMQRVWKTWKDGRILSEASLNAIEQQCFQQSGSLGSSSSSSSSSPSGGGTSSTGASSVAGILRAKDGTLILPKALRQEMQNLLDDMQTETMEMDKMSLERLADKEPELFASVKQTAQESLLASTSGGPNQSDGRGGGGTGSGSGLPGSYHHGINDSDRGGVQLPMFIMETRSPTILANAKAWKQIFSQPLPTGAGGGPTGTANSNNADAGGNMDSVLDKAIQPLKKRILDDTADGRYTQDEAMEMAGYLAAVSATASLLESLQQQSQNINSSSASSKLSKYLNPSSFLFSVSQGNNDTGGGGSHHHNRRGRGAGTMPSSAIVVNVKDFTNDGIKKKVPAVIGILYDVGLPFVSAADGRRFRTQLELSNHLDALFKRNQLEKSMTRTQERDWYMDSVVWMGETASQQGLDNASMMAGGSNQSSAGNATDDGYDPATSTMPADESRDRCIICGLNFKMEFDNDDGMYKYQNCREIEVLNDEDESELRLVHVSCWRGLGSPVVLTMFQTLQEAMH